MIASIGGFLFCAALVVAGGVRLAFQGDRIAELSGLGRVWLGLVLMAAVTYGMPNRIHS